jgi:gliding-associated putative ABC transporter substrate-binding component GldG
MKGWQQKIRFLFSDMTLVLVVLAFLVLINFWSYRHFIRLDLTENRVYTLSESSKRVAAKLEDTLTIQCFFSRKAPPELSVLKQQITDLLEEYRVSGRGKIKVIFSDPVENPLLQKRVQAMGIPQVQMNVYEKDQAQITNVYQGMAITYEDRQEILPFIKEAENLEYDITSTILRLVRNEKKHIFILTGGGEYDLNGNFASVRRILEPLYGLTAIGPSVESIPKEADLLVVVAPEVIPEKAKRAIDQYVIRGGQVFFLLDRVNIDGGSMTASRRLSNLDDLLASYGVRVTQDLVLDRFNVAVSFRTGYAVVRVPYAFFPKVVKTGFAQDNPVVSRLEALSLPWVTALEPLPRPNIRCMVLARSSSYSWLQRGMYNISPAQEFNPPASEIKSYPLVVVLEGTFPSFYGGTSEATRAGEITGKLTAQQSLQGKATKMLVMGNARFLSNNFISAPGNADFFLNAVDWFTGGDDLIGIRAKKMLSRPLPILTEQQKRLIKFGNMIGVPLVVILIGGIRFYLRRRKRTAYLKGRT